MMDDSSRGMRQKYRKGARRAVKGRGTEVGVCVRCKLGCIGLR